MIKVGEFYAPGKIIFGPGSLNQIGTEAKRLGSKALVVLGRGAMRKNGVLDRLTHLLIENNLEYIIYENIPSDPTVETVDEGANLARREKCNLVIALGGGSVLDTGKAISAMVTNEGSVADYQEIEGKGRKFKTKPIPFIAIPTTSGTGSEATRNAVITNTKLGLKKSIRDPWLIPEVALVDPELTLSLPPHITAICGGDALTQCIESYLGKKSQEITDALALHAIGLIGKSLVKAAKDGKNLEARKDMAMAALLSGLCLSNSGLGAAHALSHPLGVYYKIPHGLSCAVLLPYVMEYNLPVVTKKLAKITECSGENISSFSETEAAQRAIYKVKEILSQAGIKSNLSEWEIKKEDFPQLIKGAKGGSLNNNPRDTSDEDLIELLYKTTGLFDTTELP
ncbi:MAG: iron-containing alcohol dehydrogenase [Candidatus Caldatribacteriota bacterium]|nr:iron-containing alcohol dehydrogenase [Candidatus Caldatribacteriota bacterium]